MIYIILIIFILLAIPFLFSVYFSLYMKWESKNRHGMAYFGKSLSERKAFKETIKNHARFLIPLLKFQKLKLGIPSFKFGDIYGPSGTCSPESFEKASKLKFSDNDIVIATQMKCGTTWMQQIVYSILSGGVADISKSEQGHLHAISPWIESLDGVSYDQAPLIQGKKIIKTHFPASLISYDEKVKYIYITRNPISCFASMKDFFKTMSGPLCPSDEDLLTWFLSDQAWWGSWPKHILSWWNLSQERDNIRFIHFQDLKNNPRKGIMEIASFLEQPLESLDIEKILNKTSFEYMKENEDYYEMSPPNLFSVHETFFKSGTTERGKDLSETVQSKIMDYCEKELEGSSYPFSKIFS